ncbi:transglycosylase SLT domain-containing protein [Herbaspirillum huttiense F1]|jgi:Soluble lytic murein transglycosylase and related regulatory proteins (some contain LysM/invasin domains)|uniref:Transglycosylase SLT domain-containing protein n=1 Tax=Herbaspirillum huttiense subsp. lycopersici TaxID=3074428 RepID=A0ABU2EKT6_9BURK|nr:MULTISPECIES: lytic transglycosylase domain-containing protein [Herbaspirillum]MBP1316739.1 soluble lytic murein transglycosylase-like protein [Herbaspirillum sp. 1130]MDR6740031.1 soluble lytic murein transglycosylase-like protein [Herbaspirillum sp. 1173]MDR9848362.1 transglycosylase SLT domain-containing protein [Herbaspirillum huttiense SE1]MDT0356362.1 transglycosylase SLT domain-containing protein [Herbaspirillum huttiense F1]
MSNQASEAPLAGTSQMVRRVDFRNLSGNPRIAQFFGIAHRLLTILGIAALFVLGLMFFNPDLADKLISMSPFSDAAEEVAEADAPAAPALADLMAPTAPVATVSALAGAAAASSVQQATAPAPAQALSPEERQLIGNPRQQKLVTNWLAKRYRVASDAADMLVSAAYLTARDIKLDPLLILSVIAIESRFNPFAESPMGAQGLMQVMSKVHHDKFQELGGIKAALNPVANIRVGSQILKEYVTRGGSVEAGLKSYVGAADMANDGGYGIKVLSEYQNLKQVAMGKNVSIYTTATVKLPPASGVSASADQPKPTANNVASAAKPKTEEQLAAL